MLRELQIASKVRLFLPLTQTIRHVGEKHKTKGLIMPKSTWQAIELSSLLAGTAQCTTRSQCWWGPLGPALLPSYWGVAAALLHHLVVCRGAGKSPPFFYFPPQPTQWLSVRGLGEAEPKGRESVLWFQSGSPSLDGDIWLFCCPGFTRWAMPQCVWQGPAG